MIQINGEKSSIVGDNGSDIISSDYYRYAFFSANTKLPVENTSGVVVAFYVSTSTN